MFASAGDASRTIVIESCRPHGDRFLVRFAGIDDRSAAEPLVNATLWAAPIAIDDETLWVHRLIGSRVVDVAGRDWGECTSVIVNPAHDILELASGTLVPVTFVVSCEDGITVIDPPEGLDSLGEDAR